MSDPQTYSRGRTSAPANNGMPSHVPREYSLLCGRNEWRVHRQLQVTQDFLDDMSFGNRHNDPQPAFTTSIVAYFSSKHVWTTALPSHLPKVGRWYSSSMRYQYVTL